MNRGYHKWYSPRLDRDMELLVFGHGGDPLIVFPTAMGRFYDWENQGMIVALGSKLENGELQAVCVDSVDSESWCNRSIPPRERVARHDDYEGYLLEEVMPFIAWHTQGTRLGVTGCDLGGYHALNFAFRHPDLVSTLVAMGATTDIRPFLDGYFDESCYYHSPLDYMPNLTDPWYLDRIRSTRIVLAVGENDPGLAENVRMSEVLNAKGVGHYLDIWRDGTGRDWRWWRSMAQKFF